MSPSDLMMNAVITGMVRFDDQPQFDPDTVTPGFVGFIATFGVAALVILLVIDMVRRIRRVNYRAQVRAQLDREADDAAATGTSAAKDGPA